MRLGGRLAAAIEILDDMDARKRPVADAMRASIRAEASKSGGEA